MKRLFLVLASMASVASTFAQDVIVKRDGEEIQCRILEVSTNKVKYKQWKNQEGPTFVEKKSDVIMLKYENGQKEVLNYSGIVSASQVEEPVAVAPVDSAALADTMPISQLYLEYARKEKSGLLEWGRSISEEKAHQIMEKDWTEFSRAHRSERVGRAMIFTGGAFIVGGGVFTGLYIGAVKDYNDKKSAYDKHIAEANDNYAAKVNGLNSNVSLATENLKNLSDAKDNIVAKMNQAQKYYDECNNAVIKAEENYMHETPARIEELKRTRLEAENELKAFQSSFSEADVAQKRAEADLVIANDAYKSYLENGTANFNNEFYDSSYQLKMDDAYDYKKATLYPMIGCYASGAALLVVGIIKEKRARQKVNQIVTRKNAEDVYPGELPSETSKKVDFDVESRGNGLAFVMKF